MILDRIIKPSRSMKKLLLLSLTAIFSSAVPSLRAQWIQTTTAGPSDYNDLANWQSGKINGQFTNAAQDGLIVTFGSDTTLGTGTSLAISNNGAAGSFSFIGSGGNRTLTLPGNIVTTKNSGTRIFAFGSSTDGQQLNIDLANSQRTITVANNDKIVFLNVVSSSGGDFGITQAGSGNLVLANSANTFTGQMLLQQGTLVFSSLADAGMASSLGAATDANSVISFGGGAAKTVVLQFGGDPAMTVSGDSISNRAILFTGTQTTYTIANLSVQKLTLTSDFQNAATGNATEQIVVSGSHGSVTEIQGVIGNINASQPTSLMANGFNGALGGNTPFTLRLTGTANTFSGNFATGYNTIVAVAKLANAGAASSIGTGASDPTIIIGGTGSTYGSTLSYIGAADSSTDRPVNLQFRSSSTNTISNDSPTNSALTFSGTVAWSSTNTQTSGNNKLVLQGSSTGLSTIAAGLQDAGSRPLSLIVSSAGTWALTSSALAFSGATTVTSGVLEIDGALTNTSGVAVTQGTLSGIGTINATATVTVGGGSGGAASAIIAPGVNGAVGTLQIGALSLTANSAFQFDINSDMLTADLLNASGKVALGNGVAQLLGGSDFGHSALAAGTTLTILQTNAALTGTFANQQIAIGVNLFNVTYTPHSVQIIAVPEAHTVGLITVGGAILWRCARRSRRTRRAQRILRLENAS